MKCGNMENIMMRNRINRQSYVKYLMLNIPKCIFFIFDKKNHTYIHIHKYYILMISFFLYKDLNSRCNQLIDITCIDFFLQKKRFEIIYQYLSHEFHRRIFLKFFISELESVNSIINEFPNSSWYEREIWDLFGVYFIHNKYLKRIMLDYGFIGHPLRKDFPLTGFLEVAYSYFFSTVVHKKVNLSQSFRKFETVSNWSTLNSSFQGKAIKRK
uniref:NADH dehydrogenase subunit 9 n=1 Tax=Pleurostomum flabellatum TaxID=405751 RepID=A0A7T0M4J3_9EUKA|nr:NADH dehydrogenase subunit 9 [Pleurostomum flabellatum]QPL15614.1 NADH dehydrogenase subunit 9 [Pleurostomum flabellatum]